MSGRWESNPQPQSWEDCALPLRYYRKTRVWMRTDYEYGKVHAGKERYADDPLRNGELIKTVNSATIGIVDGGAVKPRHPYHMSRHGGCGYKQFL